MTTTSTTISGEATPLVSSVRQQPSEDEHSSQEPMHKFLSLDFDRIVNSYSIASTRARNANKKIVPTDEGNNNNNDNANVISDRGFTVSQWVLTIAVGLLTGITAVVILASVERMIEFRVERLNQHLLQQEHTWAYLAYSLYNLLLVSTSTLLCLTLAPGAVGSGIPEVMAYLNGVRVGLFDNSKLFLVKVVSTVFSVSSGLVIGPEGPVVHLGGILGALVTKTGDIEWFIRKFQHQHPRAASVLGCGAPHASDTGRCQNSVLSHIFFYLSHFRNDLERRHLISVGAGAGFAAAFGAPVGGLLYTLEETSSFFARSMLWKTLVGTVTATVCIAIYHGDFTKYSMLSLEIGVQEENLMARFAEVPLYLVIGVGGGLLGGAFNNVYQFMNHQRNHFYARFSKKRCLYMTLKVLEVAVVSLITSFAMLTLPLQASWACKEIEKIDAATENIFVHRYNCPPGHINEIGGILFGSREESIKEILTDPTKFEPETLLSVALVFLGLMCITFGIAIPTGMFMPTVLTGACLGGYLGVEFQQHVNATVHPTDFALIGAAAFLSGMQRNVVSLCVILMEGTGQTKVIIPIIITVVLARSVGDLFSEGIYEIGVELKGYPYLHQGEKFRYDAFTAKDVMKTDIGTVHLVEPAWAIESLLLYSSEQAFAVVEKENGHYCGVVRRDQLIAALECKLYTEAVDQQVAVSGKVKEEEPPLTFKAAATAVSAFLGAYKRHRRPVDIGAEYVHAQSSVTVTDWDAHAPETSSPWLRDNVLTSDNGNEIMFGMDETLPDGIVEAKEKAIIKTVDGKVVVYIPPSEANLNVNIGLLMNRAMSITVDFPLSKTYNSFGSLGLRHLPVLARDGTVAGIITRDELLDEHIMDATGYKLY